MVSDGDVRPEEGTGAHNVNRRATQLVVSEVVVTSSRACMILQFRGVKLIQPPFKCAISLHSFVPLTNFTRQLYVPFYFLMCLINLYSYKAGMKS